MRKRDKMPKEITFLIIDAILIIMIAVLAGYIAVKAVLPVIVSTILFIVVTSMMSILSYKIMCDVFGVNDVEEIVEKENNMGEIREGTVVVLGNFEGEDSIFNGLNAVVVVVDQKDDIAPYAVTVENNPGVVLFVGRAHITKIV